MFDLAPVIAVFAALTLAVTAIGALKVGPAGIMTGFRWVLASIIK